MIRNFDRITTIVAFGYQLTFWYWFVYDTILHYNDNDNNIKNPSYQIFVLSDVLSALPIALYLFKLNDYKYQNDYCLNHSIPARNYMVKINYRSIGLNHFSLMLNFYTPWKRQKTFGFLTFSGGIEMKHWAKMG